MSLASGSAAPLSVMGTGRSGTTLLRALLNAHPALHLTFEGSFFSFPRPRPRPDDRGGGRWLAHYRRTLPYRWLRLAPGSVERSLARPASEVGAPAVMAALMRAAASRHGRPRWGDKTPTHLLHLPALFAAFPNARVLHLVRDPRGAVASLARMPWAPAGVALNALFVRAQLARVPTRHPGLLELRLEDLLSEPEPTLRRALAFADLPWDDRLLDHPNHTPDDVPPFPWLLGARRPLGLAAGHPSSELTAAERRLVERICAPALLRYGYPPGDPTPIGAGELRALLGGLTPLPRTLVQLVRIALLLRGSGERELAALVDRFMATNGRHGLAAADRARVLTWLEATPPAG